MFYCNVTEVTSTLDTLLLYVVFCTTTSVHGHLLSGGTVIKQENPQCVFQQVASFLYISTANSRPYSLCLLYTAFPPIATTLLLMVLVHLLTLPLPLLFLQLVVHPGCMGSIWVPTTFICHHSRATFQWCFASSYWTAVFRDFR